MGRAKHSNTDTRENVKIYVGERRAFEYKHACRHHLFPSPVFAFLAVGRWARLLFASIPTTQYMAIMSRRSSRLSNSLTDDDFAPSTSKRRTAAASSSSASASSSRSSAASSGIIPTVAARNAASKTGLTRKETRLEDLLDDTMGDETRRMDVSIGAFLSEPSQPKRRAVDIDSTLKKAKTGDKNAKPKRKLRQTLGEEAEDDFVFTREPTRNPPIVNNRTASQRNGLPTTVATATRTTFEPLSDARDGETPIIRRNQAFRAGLEKHPRLPTGKEASSHRRSSLGLKGQKRVSSLRDGTVAYPHDGVPDHELYRHCSADLPPVIRMKHLTAWILKRSLDIALSNADLLPSSTKASSKKGKAITSALPTFTEAELKLVQSKQAELTAVLEQVLTDLNSGAFGISWMDTQTKNSGLKPHPRNDSNRQASTALGATVDKMTQESRAWSKELVRIEDYEAETLRLEQLLAAGTSESQDVIAWDRHDLDETGLRQLQDAEAAMEALRRLDADDAVTLSVEPPAKGKTPRGGKGRASKAAAVVADATPVDLQGTQRDARWQDVEFNIDLLRSRSHQYAQLETLAAKYIRTVSAHAAQALRDRTSSSSALTGTSTTSSSQRGKRKVTAGVDRGAGTDRLEMLLSGVRESKSISSTDIVAAAAQHQHDTPHLADHSIATTVGDLTTVQPFEADETDPTDLLRALARMGSSSSL